MSLSAQDVKMAKNILPLVNWRVKSNDTEYTNEEFLHINCIVISGMQQDGSCDSVYTCIFEITAAQLETWETYKGYLRRPSFTKEIPERGLTLIGWF